MRRESSGVATKGQGEYRGMGQVLRGVVESTHYCVYAIFKAKYEEGLKYNTMHRAEFILSMPLMTTGVKKDYIIPRATPLVIFLSKIANSFMLKPHNLFSAGPGRNNHKIFIFLGGSRQEGGDNPFVQEGFGPLRWLNNALFVVSCAFYCRKTERQANSSVF
ncbi:hypothetical protein AVEN_23587-1 [Araneus ventricosus]|uniref:Uncharacterized protein n=1 Tax=Araneus ventricosus TaxID=182803 RepID=A0A4Y2PSP2_ARAVE|nr:hypothetical protein AVEN_140422-1 [Araneus ventricosus]GBN54209.1 hypothetical protein AVEN_34949-1 [Araneus ventricosus]GBN54330.1 hypothetical protein AVEN_222479-1 [Araneus ventricosus]GBN54367.1 hypothetical protein AVEN_23587-1 [Araneus ventricosus]